MTQTRLNANEQGHFDKWRSLYAQLSDSEHAEYYNQLESKYPHQQQFSKQAFLDLFEVVNNLLSNYEVIELGGWKGELANFLSQNISYFKDFCKWHNFELSSNAVQKTVVAEPFYTAHIAKQFKAWRDAEQLIKQSKTRRIFVASHVLEHVSDEHFRDCVQFIKESAFDLCILELPIKEEGKNDWSGYGGTHILEYSWSDIDKLMRQTGYFRLKYSPYVSAFVSLNAFK